MAKKQRIGWTVGYDNTILKATYGTIWWVHYPGLPKHIGPADEEYCPVFENYWDAYAESIRRKAAK